MQESRYYSPALMGSLAQLMPGVTATGRPGEFDIPGYGVRKFADIREGPIYDMVEIPAANAKGDDLVWFRDTANKNKFQTNMTRQAALAQGQEAIVRRVSFVVRPGCPVKDKQEILDCGYAEFVLDEDNIVMEGPLLLYPEVHGLYGNMMTTKTDTDEGVLSNGLPSPGANPSLLITHYLFENRTFMFKLHFYEACDLPSLADTAAWVILDCIRARPVR